MSILPPWRQNRKAGRPWRLLGAFAFGRGSRRQSWQLVFDFEVMGTQTPDPRLKTDVFDNAYVIGLFDRMGPTYAVVNFVSSFGFSEVWRRQCVEAAELKPGERVADLMAGTGEFWRYIQRQCGELVAIDFSPVMARRQQKRNRDNGGAVDVRCENALHTSLWDGSLDCAVSAFGLKTLSDSALRGFAGELWRILKPGGRFSLMEISTADGWRWAPIFRWYVNKVIPAVGKLCLGDIECYRMLVRTPRSSSRAIKCERSLPMPVLKWRCGATSSAAQLRSSAANRFASRASGSVTPFGGRRRRS